MNNLIIDWLILRSVMFPLSKDYKTIHGSISFHTS